MSTPSSTRRRLTPEARRAEILAAARRLFSARPFAQVTLADVAAEAGCSKALVHSYFGAVPDLFLAVAADSGAALSDVRVAGLDTPLEERLEINIGAGLDVIARNRETWWGIMGHRSSGDARIDALAAASTTYSVQRTLENNAGLIEDTPATRSALRALVELSTETTRQWLAGEITREQAQILLVSAYRDVIRNAIPELERAAAKI